MPIEDMIDERCPFCRHYLTDLDDLWQCMRCGASYDEWGWELPEQPFLYTPIKVYNSEGKVIQTNFFPMDSSS